MRKSSQVFIVKNRRRARSIFFSVMNSLIESSANRDTRMVCRAFPTSHVCPKYEALIVVQLIELFFRLFLTKSMIRYANIFQPLIQLISHANVHTSQRPIFFFSFFF